MIKFRFAANVSYIGVFLCRGGKVEALFLFFGSVDDSYIKNGKILECRLSAFQSVFWGLFIL